MTSISSLSSASYSTSYTSSLDKNGDGVVTADELAAASSSSSSSKSSVFSAKSSSDSSGDDTSTSALDKLSALISSLMLQMTSGESQPQSSEDRSGDLLTALDADGDGALSETEFLAGKPDDVSDTDSANLFSSLDADGNGSLSTDELAAQQQPEGPPPPPPMGGPMGAAPADETDSDSASSESSTVDFLEQLQSVIDSYLENLGGDTDQTETLLAA